MVIGVVRPFQEENMDQSGDNKTLFQSLHTLRKRWTDGTFSDILADWKWIFSYSKRYKLAILFYTLLGVSSTSFGLVASVAGKYAIDIITGYQTSKLGPSPRSQRTARRRK